MTRLVVLDIDDTLYLERDYVRSGFTAVGELVRSRTGASDFAEMAWSLFQKGARGEIFDLTLHELAIDQTGIQMPELIDCYRRHEPNITLLPDAANFIAACTANSNVIAVVTDGPAESQRAKVRALRINQQANAIVITSEMGEQWHKPSTAAFQFLQEKFEVIPNDCVYYGDNPSKDFIGPRAIGWKTVRVRRPGGLHEAIEFQGEADRLIYGFDGELRGLR